MSLDTPSAYRAPASASATTTYRSATFRTGPAEAGPPSTGLGILMSSRGTPAAAGAVQRHAPAAGAAPSSAAYTPQQRRMMERDAADRE
ncbi:hypothetical protein ACHAWF_007885, partial [Thalassiosira exigua]